MICGAGRWGERMQYEPARLVDRLLGGVLGLIVVLIVLAAVLPVITPYVVALGILVVVVRTVWFYTGHR